MLRSNTIVFTIMIFFLKKILLLSIFYFAKLSLLAYWKLREVTVPF